VPHEGLGMSQRVLSTEAARAAIQKMQMILSGDLQGQIGQLEAQGETLSDPNVWDGPYAMQFRSEWPQQRTALMDILNALDELRVSVQRVNENIMQAGGGS
jgi:uncharacterized protein YukE